MTGVDLPRPIATVDLAIFALAEDRLRVLLAHRAAAPFAGAAALPGGFVHVEEDDDLEAAARRVILAKTGVKAPYLEQVRTIGDARRDPRGWSLSVGYLALLSADDLAAHAREQSADAFWAEIVGEGVRAALAFDHAAILKVALARLRAKVEYSTLPAHLLPRGFTLGELQALYERILGRKLDKSAFRNRIAEADFLAPIAGEMRRGSNRPAQVYRLKRRKAPVLFDRLI